MSNVPNQFKGLAGVLNVPDNMIPPDDTPIATVQTVSKDLYKNVSEPALNNEDFISVTLKNLITNTSNVLEHLQKEIRIGSADRTYEVYSTLANTISTQIGELSRLSVEAEKAKTNRKKLELQNNKINKLSDIAQQGKVTITSSALSKLLKNAQQESEMKNIDTVFEVVDFEEKEKEHE